MTADQALIAEPSQKWYALRVKTRSERLIATVVRHKGYDEFVPVYRCRRRWSDRVKVVDVVLFPGYVFCRLHPAFRLPLLTIPGVLYFVGIRNTPIPIDDAEMQAIRVATQSGLRTEPWPYMERGEVVRLQGGPLGRMEGLLVDSRSRCRLIVSMSLLRRSIAVEIDKAWILPQGSEKESVPSPLSLAKAYRIVGRER